MLEANTELVQMSDHLILLHMESETEISLHSHLLERMWPEHCMCTVHLTFHRTKHAFLEGFCKFYWSILKNVQRLPELGPGHTRGRDTRFAPRCATIN